MKQLKYMLDTNAVIMAIRHPDWPVTDKIKKHLGGEICISSVTYGELVYGIWKSSSPERNRVALTWILSGIRILDFDISAAENFGQIMAELERQGRRIGDRDTMIAAHARSRGLTLVTNNTKEFSRVSELKTEDWK